ncbi:MAG: hypothetical protein LBO80_07220 [Treponema sp.]|nr:hypothetical protein [Treponema sp.]
MNAYDNLVNIVSQLAVVSDFVQRIDDDSYLLDKDTPAGLHLIMTGCIADLRRIIENDGLSAPSAPGR